jgi:DNA primase
MAIDFTALRDRHHLAGVARRTGFELDRDNGDLMVCCPVAGHDDRSPSMILHLDTDRYHCFGCGAGGDVVQWIRDIYQVSVVEAVKMLDTAGQLSAAPTVTGGDQPRTVVSSGRRTEPPDLKRTPPERALAALDAAWGYYSYGALHHAGVEYLNGRGIDVTELETEIAQPVIGRTPYKAPDRFVTKMRQRGFTDDELVDAGLASRLPSRISGGRPAVIDFYRHRFIVPVRDDHGQVIGLIGRYDGDTGADKLPKYKNPPRTVVYDKAAHLYRPTTPVLDADGQVVVVEGCLDALAIAAAAATAGLSAKFAPVSESGTALSHAQIEQVMAIHDRAPVLAADGDATGVGANAKWAAALALKGRESAIVAWPDREDPASWLATHSTGGLAALTRKGCLEASPDQLRPRHSAAQVAKALLGRDMPLEAAWRAAVAPAEQMADSARERYLSGAAKTLAPVVVAAAVEASVDRRGRVDDVILTVASYGRRLPSAAQVRYAEHAGLAIELHDLGAAGWAGRRIEAAIGFLATTEPAVASAAVVVEVGR